MYSGRPWRLGQSDAYGSEEGGERESEKFDLNLQREVGALADWLGRFGKMVVRTERCAFSEAIIVPGKGIKFVKKDGQPVPFLNSKCKSLYQQRIKPAKLRWTAAWRRMHKKDRRDQTGRTRKRKVIKRQKPIHGLTLQDIKKKRAEKPAERSAAREAARKEIAERQKKKKGGK